MWQSQKQTLSSPEAGHPNKNYADLSRDGHVKFWKKQPQGIEFVKQFRAHLGPLTSMSVSADGMFLCTTSVDQTLKVYDVINFGWSYVYMFLMTTDMINMTKLPFVPASSEFIFTAGTAILAWYENSILISDHFYSSEKESPNIHIYDAVTGKLKQTLTLHNAPVKVIKVISTLCSLTTSVQSSVWCCGFSRHKRNNRILVCYRLQVSSEYQLPIQK